MEFATLQNEWMKTLKIFIVILILLIVYKPLKNAFNNLRNYDFFNTDMVPNKCSQFTFSVFCLVSLYNLSRPASPLLCLILQAIDGVCEMFEKERIFRFFIFHKPGILLYKPETVEAVLNNSAMIDKSVHYKLVHSWLGMGLFTSSGSKWRARRKLLTPTFHFSILEDFVPVFQEQSNILVSKLKDLTREPWVDIVPLATSCTFDIICQTAMGVTINAQRNENNEYVQAVHEITNTAINRAFQPLLYPDILFNLSAKGRKYRSNLRCAQGFTRKVIKEKKAEMLQHDSSKQKAGHAQFESAKRKAFLESLLELQFKDPSFTDEDIREEVDTFMFAGHDTTGMGISFILYCIGLYPEVQAKIVEELDEIFQGDSERPVTREDLSKLKYLECVIKETFRLYPPAPFFLREGTEFLEILGHKIYPGCFYAIVPYALHRDRESFPDPERFLPERFFPENSRGRHPYAYIPFSAGPRNCIGQKFAMIELKTIASNVLRNLRITSLDPRDKVLVTPNLVLRTTAPLRLRFESRW